MKKKSLPTGSYNLDGFLVTYNSSVRKDITKINYHLFGRIVNVKKENRTEKYYYPGVFENNQFKKLSNGCYFVENNIGSYDGLINILPAVVTFSEKNLQTARDYWKEKIKGKVHNW